MAVYYNENDPYAAQWLRNLIQAGHIAPGDVDERSIVGVRGDELRGYTQAHFFAGIGGWSYALRLAGWPDDRPVWTGSCPCQPFSQAGQMERFADERHLWPTWIRLIAERRPPIIFGEQVASATEWLRLVRGDLEALAYAVGAAPIEAASAGADHLRDRFWFLAYADDARPQGWPLPAECADQWASRSDGLADADEQRLQTSEQCRGNGIFSGSAGQKHGEALARASILDDEWVACSDGKTRRVKPGIRLLAHGIPNRVGLLRGFGNAIDPRPAAAFIAAASDAINNSADSSTEKRT